MDQIEASETIATFWSRLLAFIIDSIILGLLGFLLTLMFGNFFSTLQTMGRMFIGFPISLLYFGLMDSHLFSGQTIGKKIMSMKVVNRSSELLSIRTSLMRSCIFIFPAMLNGTHFPYKFMENVTILIIVMILIWMNLLAESYLYLFNKGNRQTLHDLLSGSFVVKSSTTNLTNLPQVWKGHLIVTGIILVMVFFGSIKFTSTLKDSSFSQELDKLESSYAQINTLPGLSGTSISIGKTVVKTDSSSTETKTLTVDTFSKEEVQEGTFYKKQILDILCKNFSEIKKYDTVMINFKHSISIGIYGTNSSHQEKSSTDFCVIAQ